MKPLGRKKTKTKVEEHQDCEVCHPKTKRRKEAEQWLLKEDLPACIWCGRIVLVGWCCTAAKLDAEYKDAQ